MTLERPFHVLRVSHNFISCLFGVITRLKAPSCVHIVLHVILKTSEIVCLLSKMAPEHDAAHAAKVFLGFVASP